MLSPPLKLGQQSSWAHHHCAGMRLTATGSNNADCKSTSGGGTGAELRKGPWTADEDEILLDYVRAHGPRDWSSIRSKGLLPRTGKSCRLRWVNKLKPNLKSGCKFSAEEEGIVIHLQAQLGNKWAKIATYLPGRTDNDVKNFWSTRQKRLARLLRAPLPNLAPKFNKHQPHPASSSSSSSNLNQDPRMDLIYFDEGQCSGQSCAGSFIDYRVFTCSAAEGPQMVNLDSSATLPESPLIQNMNPTEPEGFPVQVGGNYGIERFDEPSPYLALPEEEEELPMLFRGAKGEILFDEISQEIAEFLNSSPPPRPPIRRNHVSQWSEGH